MNKTIYEAEFTKMVHDKLREANRLHECEKISKDKLGGNYWDTYWTIRYMLRTIEDILAKKQYVLEWKEQAEMCMRFQIDIYRNLNLVRG